MKELPAISALAEQIKRGELSPAELTRDCLQRIEQLNPLLNAFISVLQERAASEARMAESEIRSGLWRGPLHGIPIALKDIIGVAGLPTTAASAHFQNSKAQQDAEVVRRLREAGAIIIGKNNLHEFAYGGSSLVSFFGDVKNPQDPRHIAGGSSGGSAAAVAAGMVPAAIGTDTAGSIRQPAALCGCVGLKPTYGRVSIRGVVPLSASLDHVGPLTRSVEDAAIIMQAIAGYDRADVTTAKVPVADYSRALKQQLKDIQVGVVRSYFFDELDPEVAAAIEEAIRVLQTLVSCVKEVRVEVPTDRALQAAESYAYHAERVAQNPELFQPETLRRINVGESVTAAEYITKRRELDESRRAIQAIFADVHLLVTPTTPIPAPTIAELKLTPEALRPAELKLLRNTRPFNVWGLPAISAPCGFTKEGMPIGLQIAGPPWREDLVLQLAHTYEKATGWNKRPIPQY